MGRPNFNFISLNSKIPLLLYSPSRILQLCGKMECLQDEQIRWSFLSRITTTTSIPEQAWTHISISQWILWKVCQNLTTKTLYWSLLADLLSTVIYSIIPSFTVAQVAKSFLDNVYKLHGLPTSMVTDRDKIYTGMFWKECFKILSIELNFTTAYHPQSDG